MDPQRFSIVFPSLRISTSSCRPFQRAQSNPSMDFVRFMQFGFVSFTFPTLHCQLLITFSLLSLSRIHCYINCFSHPLSWLILSSQLVELYSLITFWREKRKGRQETTHWSGLNWLLPDILGLRLVCGLWVVALFVIFFKNSEKLRFIIDNPNGSRIIDVHQR